MNIPLIIPKKDFRESEEKRKAKVIQDFIDNKKTSYKGVPDDVWKKQLDIALMTESELMLYAINNPPTFVDFHGCDITHLTVNLHTTDDQGFEGQVMERDDGSRWFCRWFEEDIGFDREYKND